MKVKREHVEAASNNEIYAALLDQLHADALLLHGMVVGFMRVFHVVDLAIWQQRAHSNG